MIATAVKKKKGRRKVGTPFSITLTDAQWDWVLKQVKPGSSKCQVIRDIIQKAMKDEK